MNPLPKLIFRLAIGFIAFWLLFPLLRRGLDLEFATDVYQSNYQQFIAYTVPISLLLTLFGTIQSKDENSMVTLKVVGTVVVAVLVMFVMFFTVFMDMCSWSNEAILFEKKSNSETKIMLREFGCGATDSGPPLVGEYKVQYFTKFFIRSTPVDTTEIDKEKWIRIDY